MLVPAARRHAILWLPESRNILCEFIVALHWNERKGGNVVVFLRARIRKWSIYDQRYPTFRSGRQWTSVSITLVGNTSSV